MIQRLVLPFFFWLLPFCFYAQGAVYTLKGGPVLGLQKWDNQLGQRNPLLGYHLIASIEELTEDNRFTVFAQAGYHTRGTSTRTTFLLSNGTRYDQTFAIKFFNASLAAGAKKRFITSGSFTPYYLLGVRGEYTVKTNLDQFESYNQCYPIYPIDNPAYIKKFNYGAIFGGGLEFPFSDLVGGVIEFTVNPDFSYQYIQPRVDNIINNCGNGGTTNPVSIPKREITNLSFEISLGIRLLHKVEYMD